MSENDSEKNKEQSPQVVVIRKEHSIAIPNIPDIPKGLIAFICGFISIFTFTLLFAPLSLVFVILSYNRKEPSGWRIGAIICSIIGILTSPIIIGIFIRVLIIMGLANA